MTHLRIELNNILENVSSAVIEKLYNICYNDTLDNISNLAGLLHTDITYRAYTTYLMTMFPELTITADAYAIPFEDPNMVTYLNSIGVGSNGMITEALAAAATIVANSANTTVTKFNELRYFTNITGSRGGFTAMSDGFAKFANWTALEEVDISNYTTIGHNNSAAYGDTFTGCTSLRTVTASSNLSAIGHSAFSGCTNLENITGLSGTILLASAGSFYNCSKLTDSSFQNVTFDISNANSCFYRCSLLTTLNIAANTTRIPDQAFYGCTNLRTVNGIDFSNLSYIGHMCLTGSNVKLSGDITTSSTIIGRDSLEGQTQITSLTLTANSVLLYNYALNNCSGITLIVGSNKITHIGEGSFNGCSNLTYLDLSGLTGRVSGRVYGAELGGMGKVFALCTNLRKVIIGHLDYIGANTYRSDAGTFYNCQSLEVIDIGSMDNIYAERNSICANCTSLSTFILRCNTPPTINIGNEVSDVQYAIFGGYNCNVYVPDAAVNDYKAASGWSSFASHIYPLSDYIDPTA